MPLRCIDLGPFKSNSLLDILTKMLQSLRNMQGEVRDEDTLGLAGLQGLPHTHHDQVVQDHFFYQRPDYSPSWRDIVNTFLGRFHQHPVGIACGGTS